MEELGQEQQMSELSPTGEARGSGSLRPLIPSTHRDREPTKAACWACAPGSGGRRVQGSGGAGPGQVEGAPVKGGGVYSLWQELDPACGRKGPECVLRPQQPRGAAQRDRCAGPKGRGRNDEAHAHGAWRGRDAQNHARSPRGARPAETPSSCRPKPTLNTSTAPHAHLVLRKARSLALCR